jgi:hypothetical protein
MNKNFSNSEEILIFPLEKLPILFPTGECGILTSFDNNRRERTPFYEEIVQLSVAVCYDHRRARMGGGVFRRSPVGMVLRLRDPAQ